jgi:hypothetical protein
VTDVAYFAHLMDYWMNLALDIRLYVTFKTLLGTESLSMIYFPVLGRTFICVISGAAYIYSTVKLGMSTSSNSVRLILTIIQQKNM